MKPNQFHETKPVALQGCLLLDTATPETRTVSILQIEVRGKVVTAQPQRKFYFAVNKPKVGNT